MLQGGLHPMLSEALQSIADIERISSRIALQSARPRDLTALRASLQQLPQLRVLLGDADSPLLLTLQDAIEPLPELTDLLQRAVIEEPPLLIRDGGVIAAGDVPNAPSEQRTIRHRCRPGYESVARWSVPP